MREKKEECESNFAKRKIMKNLKLEYIYWP